MRLDYPIFQPLQQNANERRPSRSKYQVFCIHWVVRNEVRSGKGGEGGRTP